MISEKETNPTVVPIETVSNPHRDSESSPGNKIQDKADQIARLRSETVLSDIIDEITALAEKSTDSEILESGRMKYPDWTTEDFESLLEVLSLKLGSMTERLLGTEERRREEKTDREKRRELTTLESNLMTLSTKIKSMEDSVIGTLRQTLSMQKRRTEDIELAHNQLSEQVLIIEKELAKCKREKDSFGWLKKLTSADQYRAIQDKIDLFEKKLQGTKAEPGLGARLETNMAEISMQQNAENATRDKITEAAEKLKNTEAYERLQSQAQETREKIIQIQNELKKEI